MVLGIFPGIIDQIAVVTGIDYAPTLLLVLAVAILLIQNLYLFTFFSQNEIRLKELSQQIAVLNKLIEQIEDDAVTEPKEAKNPSLE